MSWLNLNDSLNTLKGQISNFANNVLAEEEPSGGSSGSEHNYVELQRICHQQQEEIEHLRKLNAELKQNRDVTKFSNDDSNEANSSWSWNVSDVPKNEGSYDKIITDLKQTINDLQCEKQELIANLELLDSEHQLNTEKLMVMKEKLQKDYTELEDNYTKIKDDNETLVEKLKKSKTLLDDLKSKYKTVSDERNQETICTKCEKLLQENLNFTTKIETLTNEISVLKSNNGTLRKILEDTKSANNVELADVDEKLKLSEAENKILISELRTARQSITEFEKKVQADAENCKKLALILEGYEQQVSALKEELLAKASTSPSAEDNDQLRKELEETQNQLQEVLLDKEGMHKQYINILTENMKRYVDSDKFSDEMKNSTFEFDHHMSEFNHQVESILNILLDLKSKCMSLEKDIFNITEEKTKLLSEKNHEIEKLIQNSEILSQEVITKSQTIKDYENECNELIKNNDLLINELEMLKTSSSLQTISESNEDNLLLLEGQLEIANKKIEELESIIIHLENQESKKQVLEEIEEHYVSKDNYQKLAQNFEQMKEENTSLKEQIDNFEQTRMLINSEKDTLHSAVEKMKSDLENTEYQYMEININMEILKEENENQKKKIGELFEEKLSLEKLNTEYERNIENIRSELNLAREKLLLEEDVRKQLEAHIRNLTEKLQNAKMCETSLKLQYDTISKELIGTTEAKYSVETSLKSTLSNLDQCRDELLNLQQEHEKLKSTVTDLENKVDEQKISKQNYQLEASTKQLEKLDLQDDTQVGQEKEIQFLTNGETSLTGKDINYLTEVEELRKSHDLVMKEKDILKTELEERLNSISNEHLSCHHIINNLERKIEELNASKNELTSVIITKHQESVTYHNEIQRLSQILNTEVEKNRELNSQLQALKTSVADDSEIKRKDEEIEKLTDQNNFLREKCEVLAQNLLDEQNRTQQVLAEHVGPSEKEQTLSKKLERLQTHLIEVEEHYTQELLRAEEKNAELQAKVNEVEQREKNSSTMYTSVSIRANQHVETLQHQLQLITNQRDELRKKISDAEDHASKQEAALANLQFVLEQFQKDRENDVLKETERIRRQINVEKRIQDDLRNEIAGLLAQLEESKHGLLAASRLSDQLEQSKHLIITLKTEVSQLRDKLCKSEEQLLNLASQSDGKVDKSLVKNLIIGFVSSNNNLNKDQIQILKIIATVLDFNQQDHDKVNLNKPQGWFGSFLTPQSSQGMSQESLSQAFVKFLENESKPRNVPSLLNSNEETPPKSRKTSSTIPRQSPSILSEVILPTFADFAQNRNSSSILKDVLKDNS